jgi:hypothetical protein
MCRRPSPLLIALALLGVPLTAGAQARAATTPTVAILARRIAELEALTIQLAARLEALEAERLSAAARASAIAEATTPAQELAPWRRLKKGMTMADVRAILGEPIRVASGFTTYWHYSRDVDPFVMFSDKDRVEGWREPSR